MHFMHGLDASTGVSSDQPWRWLGELLSTELSMSAASARGAFILNTCLLNRFRRGGVEIGIFFTARALKCPDTLLPPHSADRMPNSLPSGELER